MCAISVKYAEKDGGEKVMDNVTSLKQEGFDLIVGGLLDDPVSLPLTRIIEVSFDSRLAIIEKFNPGLTG